jgi:hypothetical protein
MFFKAFPYQLSFKRQLAISECRSWLLGLSTGLDPAISKNREKSCFLYTQEISYRQGFLVKQKIFCKIFWSY